MNISKTRKQIYYNVDGKKVRGDSAISLRCDGNSFHIEQYHSDVMIHNSSLDAFIETLLELKQEMIKEGLIKEAPQ